MKISYLTTACIMAAHICPAVSYSASEEIRQEFNARNDFNSFWNISTWSNNAQQYSTSNVFLDTVNGWVRLKINASPQGTKPVNGEITSKRNNFLYGSYRASIKFDNIPGGVVGWFVYRTTNDIHEIDVEFLTQDIKYIHFTLHHVQTNVDHKKLPISFDPTAAFHEYRFDWYSNKVVYYIDGEKIDSLTNKVPDASCSIMLNFWSANMADWGGPAPTKDTYMYVDYMRYFSDLSTGTVQPAITDAGSYKREIFESNNKLSIRDEKLQPETEVLPIFDLLGRKAYQARRISSTASHRILWDASNSTSGAYVFKRASFDDDRNSILRLVSHSR